MCMSEIGISPEERVRKNSQNQGNCDSNTPNLKTLSEMIRYASPQPYTPLRAINLTTSKPISDTSPPPVNRQFRVKTLNQLYVRMVTNAWL